MKKTSINMQPENPELTICSVYHSLRSKYLLELNQWLTEHLNVGNTWVWLVANNTPDKSSRTLDPAKFFEVSGVDRPVEVRKWLANAYHHIDALAQLKKHIKTRFLLILDADFYIVRPRWIYDILGHMQKAQLSLFGVPWHPKHFKKIRYFPAHHSLFIDLQKIDLASLNLYPQYGDSMHQKTLVQRVQRKLTKFVFRSRSMIGSSRDVGYKLYEDYFRNGTIRYEFPQPVFDMQPFFIERFLPDLFCFVPKRREYMSRIHFRDLGYFDADERGWEEFIWRGVPFGFHLRGSYRANDNSVDGMMSLQKDLATFISL